MSLILRNRHPLWGEFRTNFDDLFKDLPVASFGNGVRSNVFTDGDSVGVEVEVSGFSREELELEVEGQVLTIRGNHEQEEKDEKASQKTYGRREFYKRSFEQRFPLSEDIDTQSAKADFKDGVLTVTFQKAADKKIQKISIG